MTARILVVDDIEANVRLLQAKLSAEYYDVLTASDGVTALAMAAADQPDVGFDVVDNEDTRAHALTQEPADRLKEVRH